MIMVVIKILQALSDLYNKNKFYGSKKESSKEGSKEGSQEGCKEGYKESCKEEVSKARIVAPCGHQIKSLTPMRDFIFVEVQK